MDSDRETRTGRVKQEKERKQEIKRVTHTEGQGQEQGREIDRDKDQQTGMWTGGQGSRQGQVQRNRNNDRWIGIRDLGTAIDGQE